jgi:glycosyltransferase involved in cell wall biosynthesis
VREVLLVTEARGFGGAEVYLERLARGLEGYAPVLAVPRHPALDAWAERLRGEGFSVHARSAGWRGMSALIARAAGPDVALVHVNLPSTYDGWSGGLPWVLSRWSGKPVVVTEHLTALPRSRRRRWVKRRTGSGVRAVIVVSKAARAHLLAEGLPPDRVIAIPNGVPDPGPPVPLPPGPPFRIGVLASLEPRKRIDVVIEAVAACPPPRPELHVAGEGPLRSELEERAFRTGVEATFHGRVEDPYAFLSQCHVLALASDLEAMPLSILEAMAAGRGVLASALPGLDEVVVEGETGRLLPPGDLTAWTETVAGPARDRDRLRAWGAAARLRYTAAFTLERSVAATAAVYDRVLEEAE